MTLRTDQTPQELVLTRFALNNVVSSTECAPLVLCWMLMCQAGANAESASLCMTRVQDHDVANTLK